MNIRIVTRTIVIPLLVFCFLLPKSEGNCQEKIRLGHSSIGATNGSFWVAEEKGLFKKNGVDVEVIFSAAVAPGSSARCSPAIFSSP